MPDDLKPADSPCLKLCKLDDTKQFCVSCWRHIDEITGWRSLSTKAQHAVLASLPERKAKFYAGKRKETQCAG
ncbi:DUF1289 domain-containing protein [Pseudovibrio axinellae]|uniref:DUF1289 domain-containing protein n=1 Tax=Pseudovibrio axinellae TaxID=989403 RepID=UPI00082BB968|nr:DUF1289 domain-containing protein [Pseudovibrio axinellae]